MWCVGGVSFGFAALHYSYLLSFGADSSYTRGLILGWEDAVKGVCLVILLAALPARAEQSVTILGTSPLAACAAAADQAVRSLATTRDAVAVCDYAIDAWPAPALDRGTALVNRSAINIALGNYRAAIADSNAALRIDDRQGVAYLNRGIALAGAGEAEAAIADFSRSLALGVKRPELAYFARAQVREDVGDVRGAYADYRAAAALRPEWAAPVRELQRFSVVRHSGV